MSGVEVWTAGGGLPGAVAARARKLEDAGWSGVGIVDSQHLSADPFVSLTAAASVTSTLRLATAVANTGTRHPAALAAVAASVQSVADGRFVLGVGRGDSALAHLGLAPVPPARFERDLGRIRSYLHGDHQPFDLDHDAVGGLRSSDTLGMSGGPADSWLHWLDGPVVPIDVAASGPKVIEIAARHADAVTFAVGIEPSRLGWAIDTARAARRAAGLDLDGFGLGTYVPVFVDDDRSVAREMLRGGVGSYARFSVMHGQVAGPVVEGQRQTLEAVHRAYDMNAHFTHGSPQSQALTDEVIDAFSIGGPAGYVRDRLAELVELGLTRLFVQGPGLGAPREATATSMRRFATEVLPTLTT